MNFKTKDILFIFILVSLSIFFNSTAYGHFDHLSHKNNGGDDLGRYYVNQALEPEYAKPGEATHIEFSIQDDKGKDVYNVLTAIEIYDGTTGQRIKLFPWELHSTGDFEIHYTFKESGNYIVVISLADENSSLEHIIPPRNLLSSNLNCDCQRAVFNISITPSIGIIWNSAMLITILLPISVFGSVLSWNFLSLRKKGMQPNKPELLKYIIMFLAVAGGIIHLGVYADHGSLRIEYSIFLLAAAIIQVAFGTFYVLITVTPPFVRSKQSILLHYNKTILLNVIGLVGTSILVGLYIYVVIFPPPLSPVDKPEEIELDGMFSKSVEIATMIGIVYLILYEKKKKMKLQSNVNTQTKLS